MKVLLLEHPRERSAAHFNDVANTPLSSCLMSGYLASYLKANDVEAEIFDAYLARHSLSTMVKEVKKRDCDILGIHLNYCWEKTPGVLSAIGEIKSAMGVPVIVYGFYPTFAFESIMRYHQSVDYVVMGEPEVTFLECYSMLKRGEKTGSIDGLAFRNGKDLFAGRRRKLIDPLDALPFPYRTKEHLDYIGGNILGSRGCYGNCTFCYINNFYGKGCVWRGRTAENIFHEVDTIVNDLQKKYIYFVDANFIGPRMDGQKRAEKIAGLLQGEKGFAFGLECRANDLSEKTLKKLVNAGLRDVFLGIESGAQRSLKRMRKGNTVQQNEKALTLLRNYDIEPSIGFIMFEPDSALQDIRDNFNFLMSNDLLGRLSLTVNLLYHPQIVFMGTDSYNNLKKESRLSLSLENSYQGYFSFRDVRVSFLADVISSICRYLLVMMDESDSPLFWRRNTLNNVSCSLEIEKRLNQWIVEYFDSLLIRLENEEINHTTELKDRYIKEAASLINKMISQVTNNGKSTFKEHDCRC